MLYAIAGILVVVGVILIFVGKRKAGLKSTIDSTLTTPIRDLMEGQHAEIKGVASCDQPLKAPYSDISCVYYSYALKCRERSRSSSGSTSYTWRTIDSGSTRLPFSLTDSTGTVTVDPEGADVDAPVVVKRPVRPGDPTEGMPDGALKTVLSTLSTLASTPHKVEVRAVTADRELYVLGDVQRRADGQLRVSKGDNKFFISTKSEEQLARSLGRAAALFYVLGAALIVGGIVVLVLALRQVASVGFSLRTDRLLSYDPSGGQPALQCRHSFG